MPPPSARTAVRFIECLARCGEAKYGELKGVMSLAQCVDGFILNVLGQKSEEAVIADTVHICAERYDWRQSKPLRHQTLKEHRQWVA
eukprot:2588356-Prymnesium_polylepis.1